MSRYEERLPRLEHYSLGFAKALFGRHPEWKQYEGRIAVGEPDLLDYFLVVNVPSANPRVVEPLKIGTLRREVTVAWFGGWHVHVDRWKNQTLEEHYGEAIRAIEMVTADDYTIAVARRGDQWTSSGAIRPGAPLPAWAKPSEPGCTTIARSWLGTHDAEW